MGNGVSRALNRVSRGSSSDISHLNKKEDDEELLTAIQSTKLYRFKELVRATNNFTDRIGRGKFGIVYKGVLKDGTLIAAKVMHEWMDGERHYLSEISLLAELEHDYIVKLHGCCVEANHRIIVYDYLKNGNLEFHLHGELPRSSPRYIDFSWDVRRRICIGVAEGLCFLHDANIVHSGIIAENILLDDELNPKISGFGYARVCPSGMSHVSGCIDETIDFPIPDYFGDGRLSIKANTYSFGVLILEIVSGGRIIGPSLEDEERDVLWDLHERGQLLELVDKSIMGDFDRMEAYKYLLVGLLCIQNDPDLLPDMSTVIVMLKGKIDVHGENLSRPGICLQRTSLRVDEGPLREHGKDDSQSLIYSKEVGTSDPDSTTTSLTVFTYKEMEKITRNFEQSTSEAHHKIYMGFISKKLKVGTEPLQVAVKIYDGDEPYWDKDNWLAQVSIFEKLSHPNLVQLIGYCYEAEHRILVYEHMPHGSLENHLFSREQSPLSWDVRMKIAIDAARGLNYLHDNEKPVIHNNIKLSNILLDMVSKGKIFGFGLATTGTEGYKSKRSAIPVLTECYESDISGVGDGTIEYTAPEYFHAGIASTKSDVYSFGVVLVELLSGRKWIDIYLEERVGLRQWTQEFLQEKKSLHKLMDARLRENYPIQGAKEVLKLAHECLNLDPQQRPSMREIVYSLRCLLEADPCIHLPSLELETIDKVQKFDMGSGKSKAMNRGTQLENRGTILMRVGLGLTEAPKSDEWSSANEIYLMQSQVTELPESPYCLGLKSLYLPRNSKLRTIPASFFYFMPVLEVLNLSRTRIKTLPDSLFLLRCLKRLFINHCELLTVLSPKIGRLKQLEVLDLHGTEIIGLPKEVANLTKLRCLELSFFGNSERNESKSTVLIPKDTIRSLSQLQELSIDVDPVDWRWQSDVKAIFDEIRGLSALNTLKLHFPFVDHLKDFDWCSMPIECFKFIVGHHANRIMSRFPQDLEHELDRWDRCLNYVNGIGVPYNIEKVLQHSTAFFLDRHTTATRLSEFGIGNMQQLKCCILGECNEVRYLVDGFDFPAIESSSEIVSEYSLVEYIFGSLEYLHVYYMRSLRGIYTGPYRRCLCNLRSLTLQTCPELFIIFTPELLGDLSNLEELSIRDCEVVQTLVICEDSTVYKSSCFLPKLKRVSLRNLPELISISSGLRIAPELEMISLYYCPKLNISMKEVGSEHLTEIEVHS